MELSLCNSSTFATPTTTLPWMNSVSPSSLHFPRPYSSSCESKRLNFVCFSVVKASSQSEKTNAMVVSITGATGFIGRRLVQRLLSDNHSVRVLTRSKSNAQKIFPVKGFPGITICEEPGWKDCIQGSSAVVNLAGLPISTRWSPEIKKEIKDSRVRVTSKVVDLINSSEAGARPKVLVSATAVGYYGTSETKVFDEQSPSGNDYLAEVCREWEGTALKVNKDVRVVLIRTGVVLGKDGGALAKMIPLFMMFAGGPLGSGKQWFSWIHLDDIVNLFYEALSNPSYQGVINGTAPNPVTLGEMCKQLGNAMGRPSWLPVPDLALKAVLGEGACVVLEGQNVVPTKAQELGFPFKYRYVRDAIKAIVSYIYTRHDRIRMHIFIHLSNSAHTSYPTISWRESRSLRVCLFVLSMLCIFKMYCTFCRVMTIKLAMYHK